MVYQKTINQFIKMLNNLSSMLDKSAIYAGQKKFDEEILWQSRLAPDQFNLTRQVQITCDTAKSCVALLARKEAPSHPDTEKTCCELKKRIEAVILYLKSFKASDFQGADSIKVTRPRWEGKYLSGEEFLYEHALPNFYFHLTTAYSILRHNGVAIGKKDYLGEMPYKRS